jgi:hypothetical protein
MADSTGPHRIVGSSERPAARRPGPAVVLVLLYAALFAAVLWWLRARSPLFQRRPLVVAPSAAGTKDEVLPRSALVTGEGLGPAARDEYFRGLSTYCCTCGCEASLRDCLLTDLACGTSREMAQEILEQLR